MPVIHALKTFLTDGTKKYPIYLGFLPANELARISEVPSFNKDNSNNEIAQNILHPPVTNWQRPIIQSKWEAIRDKFSRTGELMPNPVLLAVADTSQVQVTQQVLNGQQTNVFEISVPEPKGSNRPLWILDGQHRVKGMSESTHRTNPLPLVLLYGEGQHAYSPQQFAKVFAEVTTSATPLDPLHGTWLRYAFKLGEFSPSGPNQTDAWKAMTAAAKLCETQAVGTDGDSNPYFNKIQLNPEIAPKAAIADGFAYSALTLQELFQKEYFARPGANMSPDDFAEQISLATIALSATVTTATDQNAFFGDAAHRSKYLQDAFLVGVCRYLGAKGAPTSWRTVLEELKFNTSDWNIAVWVGSTGGSAGNISKKVANSVFAESLEGGTLPVTVADLPSYLQGDASEIRLRTATLKPNGRPNAAGATKWTWPVSGNKTINLDGQRHIKLTGMSANIGKLECVDIAAPHDNQFTVSSLKRGVELTAGGGSVRLQIRARFFGDTSADLRLNLTWK